jgi:menaquinol-cytochrome c reductase iron-sulfur subunit
MRRWRDIARSVPSLVRDGEHQRPMAEITVPDIPASRRSFLGWAIAGIVGFVAAAIAVPIVGAVASAAGGRRQAAQIRLARLTSYTVDQPKLTQFTLTQTDGWVQTLETHAVWVVRISQTEATVFNGRCTHLGCAYSWQTDRFACPCHGGTFAADGTVISGPPPRPLDRLPVQIGSDGYLNIQYQDFQLGVPAKEPI